MVWALEIGNKRITNIEDKMDDFIGDAPLVGVRVRKFVEGEKWYITLAGDEDGLLVVDITVPRENKPEMYAARVSAEVLAVVVSVALSHGADPVYLLDKMEERLRSIPKSPGTGDRKGGAHLVCEAMREHQERFEEVVHEEEGD